jgi:hypothetical protein
MTARYCRLSLSACGLLWLLPVASAFGQASDGLQPQLAPVARDIASMLKAEGEQSVTVGAFVAPPQREAGTGLGISVRLTEELKKLGIKVSRRARLGVQGKFAVAPNRKGHLVGRITVEVVDASGKMLKDFKQEVHFHGTSDKLGPDSIVGDLDGICVIAALTAPTVELPPDKNQKARHKILDEHLKDPHAFLDGTRIRAGTKSPYAIEIVVGGKARPARDEDGLAFLLLKRDEVYAVRLINDSDHDAAVALSIDGLGLFTFNEEGANFVHVMVPARKAALIPGWYRTRKKVDSFKVVGYAESPAARLLAPAEKVGTITAAFAVAWKKDAEPPADELAARLMLNRGERLATGRGPERDIQATQVERHIGLVRAVVSVRYSRN